jgi:hypothetical protein
LHIDGGSEAGVQVRAISRRNPDEGRQEGKDKGEEQDDDLYARMGSPQHPSSRAVTRNAAPLRLRGRLQQGDRGFLLVIDDGPVWRLTGAEDYTALIGSEVIVEARKVGSVLLDVLWMGPAS